MSWVRDTPQGAVLRLVIQPRASRTEVVGPHADRLKIRVAAPPVEGEANEELLRFLKKQLKCPVEVLRGATAKQKDVLCPGVSATRTRELLNRGARKV